MSSSLFYYVTPLLSKDALYNFIVGPRGGGKSVAWTKYAIDNYVKKGKTTIWIRRYGVEFDSDFQLKFFSDIMDLAERDVKGFDKYYEWQFKVNISKKTGLGVGQLKRPDSEKWETFIQFIPLNVALKHKSVASPSTNLIVFDEFILDLKTSNMRYLTNEVTTFFEYYETIARVKELNGVVVRAIFIGNAISVVNPYFTYFKIKYDKSREWIRKGDVLVHNYFNKAFYESKKATRWGKMIEGTKYGDYNLKNEFYRDSDTFIERRSKTSLARWALKYNDTIYGVWEDYFKGRVYISLKYDPYKDVFPLTTEDHEPNLVMLPKLKASIVGRQLIRAFRQGILYFDDLTIKDTFYNEVLPLFSI